MRPGDESGGAAAPPFGRPGGAAEPAPEVAAPPLSGVIADPWPQLRAFTPARLALGRAGSSLPTAELLRFGLAHAQARDAVHHALDAAALQMRLLHAGYRAQVVHSGAGDRWQYLARPDLGRRLDAASRERLAGWDEAPELLVVIGDGLSALAVERHALPVLEALCAQLAGQGMRGEGGGAAVVAAERPPVVVAREARVALGDDIAECLGARLVVVLIGERPGLSSPDSMGIYVTHAPRVGRTDAERNCISNVRPAGLAYGAAAEMLVALIRRIQAHGCSGVALPVGEDMAKVSGPI